MNYDGEDSGGVRAWAIENAAMWVRDFHVDGLRLDATHALFDGSPTHVLAELAERVKAENLGALVISEMGLGDLRPIRDWGHDAQWVDDLHHAVHVLLTGERDGYYEPYGKVADVAVALAHPEARRFVVCAQNHDQVGNRAFGDRLRGAKLGSPPSQRSCRPACRSSSWERSTASETVSVLHRPHRPQDGGVDARGPQARVRAVHGLCRGGGAGPAGRGDLRALEARPGVG